MLKSLSLFFEARFSSYLPLRGEVGGAVRSDSVRTRDDGWARGGEIWNTVFVEASPHPPRLARRPPRVGGGKGYYYDAAAVEYFKIHFSPVMS